MKSIISVILLIATLQSTAQFYYKDIITNKEATSINQLLRKTKCIGLNVKSYHFDGEEIESFLCKQDIENNAKHVITTTGSPFTGENHLHSFYSLQGQLLRSVDSNPTLIIQNNYEYTADKLTKIIITSFEPDQKNNKNIEVHHGYMMKKVLLAKCIG